MQQLPPFPDNAPEHEPGQPATPTPEPARPTPPGQPTEVPSETPGAEPPIDVPSPGGPDTNTPPTPISPVS
ncbi:MULTISPECIES: hypothetical protein [Sphingomonas]|uniref:hypothetical protein n=1 Tax=Sphingomonas TaxID=13687 RepID=UPI000DEFD3D4|nr:MULTISPECIES: hypothetical protein [Sphingomonas]